MTDANDPDAADEAPPGVPMAIPQPQPGFWKKVSQGLGRAATATGQGIAGAWNSVDPDARRQLAQMPLMGLTMLSRSRGEVRALPDDGFRPVVFVHGLGGHRGNFLPMQGWFRLHGRRRTYAAWFPDGSTVARMAEQLRAVIGRVIDLNDLPATARVDLVAHSMGGLVCRLALEDAQVRRHVHTVVTVGTPHHGTLAARWANTAHARELRPDSPLFHHLDPQLPWQAPPRLVSLWSPADLLLLPSTTACVEGADNVEVADMSHYSWLLGPRSFRLVLDALHR